MWNSGRLNYSELPDILPSDVNGEYFAVGTEKGKVLGSLMGKEVENLEDHGCPKVQDLVDEKIGFVRVTHSDTRPQFTVQSARRNCLITG